MQPAISVKCFTQRPECLSIELKRIIQSSWGSVAENKKHGKQQIIPNPTVNSPAASPAHQLSSRGDNECGNNSSITFVLFFSPLPVPFLFWLEIKHVFNENKIKIKNG